MNKKKKGIVYFKKIIEYFFLYIYRKICFLRYLEVKFISNRKYNKVNLCSGNVLVSGYCNVDMYSGADLIIDLEKNLLPFADSSIDTLLCISAINYFNRSRGEEIIKDVYRVLKNGGITRFATQDLRLIAEKYINNDYNFFNQKLPSGEFRFKGETNCDKFNSWFYGYSFLRNRGCKYFYDYETLEQIFKQAGFKKIEKKKYMESSIENIEKIDNRPDQMFFLEAIK